LLKSTYLRKNFDLFINSVGFWGFGEQLVFVICDLDGSLQGTGCCSPSVDASRHTPLTPTPSPSPNPQGRSSCHGGHLARGSRAPPYVIALTAIHPQASSPSPSPIRGTAPARTPSPTSAPTCPRRRWCWALTAAARSTSFHPRTSRDVVIDKCVVGCCSRAFCGAARAVCFVVVALRCRGGGRRSTSFHQGPREGRGDTCECIVLSHRVCVCVTI